MRYSELACFMQCPRKYCYEYIEQIERQESMETEHDKSWGQAIHVGLETWYKTHDLAQSKEAFLKVYPRQLKEDDLAKTPESGKLLLQAYTAFYYEQDKNWEILEVEKEDSFTFEDIEWTVHLDVIARNKQAGDIYFWDHKTTARTPDFSYWKSFELSSQLTAYTTYIISKYGQCSGAIVNALIVGHRQRAWKGEPAGHWFKFERQIFNRNAKQVKTWQENVRQWKTKLEFSHDQEVWPTHDSQLCNWCQFRELCIACDDEEIKETLYKKKEETNVAA